jgi:hypothetical protein
MVKKANSLRDLLLGHLIAFLFCVLFPALVTAIAPVSWIKFERQGGKVIARSRICTLFFIPYRSKTIDPVIGLGDDFIAGKYETRRTGNRERVRSEDEAFLLIHGKSDTAKIPVSPASIKSVTAKAKAFLDDPNSTERRFFVVANWKFSIFAGGLISLLTVLYVVGITLSIIQSLRRLIMSFFGSSAAKYSATSD